MKPPFRVEPLNESHDRSLFSCGQEPLDRYFKTQVTQDTRRRVATCFVALDTEAATVPEQVAAYYTLASAGIPLTDLPPEIVKKLPRYPSIPAVRVGRLAVNTKFQGRGLGAALLADALHRVLGACVISSSAASYALLVDAKDDSAANFYKHLGFIALASQPHTLFLPLATAEKILG
jgi:GNAT superfamily N-acetyltransferase